MMMIFGFWIAAGVMGFGVGAVLLRALRLPAVEQTAPHLTVYRDQLAEVERDLARNVIAPAEAARVRTGRPCGSRPNALTPSTSLAPATVTAHRVAASSPGEAVTRRD